MTNIERAAALKICEGFEKASCFCFAAMQVVRTNGLLNALAYCKAKNANEYQILIRICEGIGVNIESDSSTVRHATQTVLAMLNFCEQLLTNEFSRKNLFFRR